MEKSPSILFHCSSEQGLTELIGKRLFAAGDPADAAPFMVKRDGFSMYEDLSKENNPPYMLIDNEEAFRRQDKRGSLYIVPGKTFQQLRNPDGTPRGEYASEVPVKPIREEKFSSSLNFILGMGIQVFFVNKKQLSQFTKMDEASRMKFLGSLTSENEKRDINHQPLFRSFVTISPYTGRPSFSFPPRQASSSSRSQHPPIFHAQ